MVIHKKTPNKILKPVSVVVLETKNEVATKEVGRQAFFFLPNYRSISVSLYI